MLIIVTDIMVNNTEGNTLKEETNIYDKKEEEL